MTDKKKNNMSEKKKKYLICMVFVVLCVVVFLGPQMYKNIGLAEKCRKSMAPKCHHSTDFTAYSANVSGSACFKFDWYVPPATVKKCPVSKKEKTLDSK